MNSQIKNTRLIFLEAALYSAGRPLHFNSLKKAIKTKSDRVVIKLVKKLSKKTEDRGSALEVKVLPGNRAVMRLKPKYSNVAKKINNKPLLTSGPLKTLSYIAYHQPVEQSRVIQDRGNHVYSHLKIMEEMGLIIRDKTNSKGRVIETTQYFSDYFGFGYDPMKSKIQLRQIFNALKIRKLENGNEQLKDTPNLRLLSLGESSLTNIEDHPLKETSEHTRMP